jgi:amino acid transporter
MTSKHDPSGVSPEPSIQPNPPPAAQEAPAPGAAPAPNGARPAAQEAPTARPGHETIRVQRPGTPPAAGPPAAASKEAPPPVGETPARLDEDLIVPGLGGATKRDRDRDLTSGGARLSMAELYSRQVHHGTHPGDKYVRRVRPTKGGFRRISPGHLEALPGAIRPTSRFGRGFDALKRFVIGTPISTAAAAHERLTKLKALAVLSSDALSSVTYATEAILATLVVAGSSAFHYNIPIAIAIAVLIAIVVFSYRQTIFAYPKGGGTYIVSKDNLGMLPGLVGGASLLTGYILTVAVSISAGVANLISLAETMNLGHWAGLRVEGALIAIIVLVLLNLRGIRESGTIFAAPTYLFLVLMFGMLALGLYQYGVTDTLPIVANVPEPVPPGGPGGLLEPVTLFLLLRAFAAGCSALTGIEAISDGVPAFEKPESKNAATTLTVLGVLLAAMFLGISFLADHTEVQISNSETVVSQLGRTIFGPGAIYTAFLVFTALILVLAANTAFADFPRLSFFLARDRFLPHQFAFRGDRLAFSFGIITLGVMAGVLIVVFGGRVEGLLPLYAIGVFTAFTLSQSGMVRRWWRLRPPGWQLSLTFNAAGALTTAMVSIILAITRFGEGAWIVMIVVPLVVLVFLRIHKHYEEVSRKLSVSQIDPRVGRAAVQGAVLPTHPLLNLPDAERTPADGAVEPAAFRPLHHLVVMPVAGFNQVTLSTLAYARSLTDNVVAVHVAADEEAEDVEKLEAKWKKWAPEVPLVIVESPYRSLLGPLLLYIDALHRQQPDRILTVLIPEFVASRWWEHLLHNQSALRLKGALLFRPGIVVTSVPYHIRTQD